MLVSRYAHRSSAQGIGKVSRRAPFTAMMGCARARAVTSGSSPPPRSQGAIQKGQKSHASPRTTVAAAAMEGALGDCADSLEGLADTFSFIDRTVGDHFDAIGRRIV